MSHQHSGGTRIEAPEHPLTRRAFLRRAGLAAGLAAPILPSATEPSPSPQAAAVPSLTPHDAANLTISNVEHISASNVINTVANSGSTTFYVSHNGNDANNGTSWATAKQTILAAYDALPSSGGTIYFADGSSVGGSVANQGFWIVGPNDPNYDSPPTGWRRQKSLRLVGIPDQSEALGAVPGALLSGGSSTDPTKPVIWISGTNASIRFEHLIIQYPAIAVKLGLSSSGTASGTTTSTITFFGCSFQVNQISGNGPTIQFGYAFWVWFDKCVIHGNANGATADAKAAMLLKPADASSDLIYLIDCNFGDGVGVRYYAGNTSWSFYARNVLFENLPANGVGIEFVSVDNNGQAVLDNIQTADSDPTALNVKVDSAIDPGAVVAIATGVVGPATVFGAFPAGWSSTTETLANTGDSAGILTPFPNQIGFGPQGQITGQHDSARRSFAPAAARFANLAAQDVTTWATYGGTATVTTGVTAPDGTTKAAKLSSTALDNRSIGGGSFTLALNDWFIGGVWMQSASTAPVAGPLQLFCGGPATAVLNNSGINYVAVSAPMQGNKEWQWISFAAKVTSLSGGTSSSTLFELRCDATHPMNYYAPIFLHIPAGTISDNEAKELSLHLQSWSDAATVGQVSTLKSHIFNALGGLTVGGGKLTIPVVSADPSGLANGMIWYNSTSGTFKCYQNGAVKTFIVR